ncbi:MAG: MFS transporter [Flavobacteriales bacterium]
MEQLTKRTALYAGIASFSGFLFGFDTVVISGADKILQDLWQTSDLFHGGIVMSMALWGTVLGAIFGHIPTNILGRKKSLISIGILFTLSAAGTALAQGPWFFAIARFLGGIGIGVSTIAAPSYISEISPARFRGRLVGLYQFNIVFGIVIAFLSNFLLKDVGPNAWRYMLGVQIVPSVIFALAGLILPESVRWETAKHSISNERIYDTSYRKVLWLSFFVAFFNQLSGINAFLYYAPRIFDLAGLNEKAAHLSSVGVGLVNLCFTFLGVALVDKVGRKKLMYIGGVGYICSLGLVTASFHWQWNEELVPYFFFLFIAAHAIGQGTVIWVFISELFPDHLRAAGQGFGSTIHWILAALIPALIPYLFEQIGADIVFAIFCLAMCAQLIWIYWFMPETRGKSIEEITAELTRS